MSSPLNFHLEHYDGPLDLLLDLIRKQEINIYDIPIAQITTQYLEYMQKALEMDVELSAEFIYMAATLIQIKSKMLLPRDPALREDRARRRSAQGTGGPAAGARALQERRGNAASEAGGGRSGLVESADRAVSRRGRRSGPGGDAARSGEDFQGVLERAKNRPVYEIGKEDVSVPDMIRYLRTIFENESRHGVLAARELFERQRSRRAMICLFLALLELVKLQAVGLTQTDAFGEIGLKRLKGFEAAFSTETQFGGD